MRRVEGKFAPQPPQWCEVGGFRERMRMPSPCEGLRPGLEPEPIGERMG